MTVQNIFDPEKQFRDPVFFQNSQILKAILEETTYSKQNWNMPASCLGGSWQARAENRIHAHCSVPIPAENSKKKANATAPFPKNCFRIAVKERKQSKCSCLRFLGGGKQLEAPPAALLLQQFEITVCKNIVYPQNYLHISSTNHHSCSREYQSECVLSHTTRHDFFYKTSHTWADLIAQDKWNAPLTQPCSHRAGSRGWKDTVAFSFKGLFPPRLITAFQ